MGWKISCLFTLIVSMLGAQNLLERKRAGLIQVTGSIYPSIHLNSKTTANYLGGHLEYYFEDTYSVRGSALVFISKQNSTNWISDHTVISLGLFRNWSNKRSEVYVGFSPGLAWIQTVNSLKFFYQPTVTGVFGGKFHVSSYFYFFAESQLQHAQRFWRPGPFSQLLFTGGLGLQLPTRKSLSSAV